MNGKDQSRSITAYRLRFSGSGGEYFRVWIVNVLLTILTLGLYTPWARRRTVRYFYDHTVIADSPLEFTAPLRKMVMSFIIFGALYLSYQIATDTGQETAVLIFTLAGAVLAPYFWASAMRFRLVSTRWRGLQLHFSASWKEVYLASWPLFVVAAIWIAISLVPTTLETSVASHGPQGGPGLSPAYGGLLALGVVLSALCLIRVEFNYKSLLVLRAGLGQQRGRWKPAFSDFVRVWAATAVFFLSMVLVLALVVAGVTLLGSGAALGKALIFILSGLTVFVAVLPAMAYRNARMFMLIWNNVGVSQIARFKCDLQHWAFVRLRLRNLLLTTLSLGLYRPFARVNEYRFKTDSVTLHVKGGLDQLTGDLVAQQNGLGDAMADAVGLDIVG